MKMIFFVAFALLSFSIYSQNLEWAYSIGGSYEDRSYDLTTDNDGNVYITGGFSNNVNFNPAGSSYFLNSFANNNSDVFVAKYDADFNLLWAFSLGNSGWEIGLSISVDNEQNVYVIGNYKGEVDFDPSLNTYLLYSSEISYFLAKYNYNGEFEWAKDIGNDGFTYLNIPPRTRLYIDNSSYIYTYISYNDTLKKFSSDGSIIWQKYLNGIPVFDNINYFYSIDGFKNPFEYGYFYQNKAVFNKLNREGNVILSKTIANTVDGFLGGFISYDNSGFIMAGDFWGKIDFYGIENTFQLYNYDSIMVSSGYYAPFKKKYISKVDTSGNVIWAKIYEDCGPFPYLFKTKNDEHIFTAGKASSFTGYSTFDKDNKASSLYVAKYDSLYKYLAYATLSGGSFMGDIKFYNDTAIIIGSFYNSINMDLNNGNYQLFSEGLEDIFIAKYSDFDISANLISIKDSDKLLNNLYIYPNPSSGIFNIQIKDNQMPISIEVYNILGKMVLSQVANSNNINLDLSNYENGVYILNLNFINKNSICKLILSK